MTRWLAHSVILAVVMSMIGCVSTPQPPPQTLGFTRASQVEGSETVWIMEDDGSDPLPLDLGADGNRSVTWSPDGNDIAFVSVRDGNAEIYTARLLPTRDGRSAAKDVQRRTNSTADDGFPAWSQDCALLAFTSNRANPNAFNLYQLDLNTNLVTPITNGNYEDLSPSWSPDGSRIAFTRNVANASREIYVHVIGSGQDVRLTNNTVDDVDPSWSPSGRIIFSRHSQDGSRAALFEMDAVDANGDGNGDHVWLVSLPQANEYDRKPEYSSSGKALVFTRRQQAGGTGPGDVWKLMIQDGTIIEPLVNLTQSARQHDHDATWKRNGVCAPKQP
jgi:Tol biopolymer transport system component